MQTYKTEDTGWLQAFRKKKEEESSPVFKWKLKSFLPAYSVWDHPPLEAFLSPDIIALKMLVPMPKAWPHMLVAPRSRWSGALTQCVYPTPLAAPWAVNNDTGGSLTFNSLQVGGTFSNSRFTQTLMDFTTIQKKKCLVSFTGTEKKKWYIHLLRVKDGVHKSRNQNRIQKRQQKYISLYNKLLVVWHYSQTYFVCLYTECAHRL